jgi:hypothetical protein
LFVCYPAGSSEHVYKLQLTLSVAQRLQRLPPSLSRLVNLASNVLGLREAIIGQRCVVVCCG